MPVLCIQVQSNYVITSESCHVVHIKLAADARMFTEFSSDKTAATCHNIHVCQFCILIVSGQSKVEPCSAYSIFSRVKFWHVNSELLQRATGRRVWAPLPLEFYFSCCSSCILYHACVKCPCSIFATVSLYSVYLNNNNSYTSPLSSPDIEHIPFHHVFLAIGILHLRAFIIFIW